MKGIGEGRHARIAALGGKDVTGWPWNPPWPMCVVCVDLARGDWI